MNMTVESSGLPLLPMQAQALPEGPARWCEVAGFITLQLPATPADASLQAALGQWQAQHDALRLRVGSAAGYRGLRQFFAADAGNIPLTRLHVGDQAGHVAWLEQVVQVQADAPVALLLLEQADGGCQLVLGVLAALADQAGLALLASSLAAACAGQLTPAEEGDFEQYVQWRNEVLVDEDAATARAYWSALNARPASAQQLPGRAPQAGLQGERAQAVTALDPVLLQRLAGVGVPQEIVLQAAWWLLLARLDGQPCQVLNWWHDSRRDYDYFAESVGVYQKQLPLVIDYQPELPLRAWLQALETQLEQHATWQEYFSPESAPALQPAAIAFRTARARPVMAAGWQVVGLQAPQHDAELLLQVDTDPAAAQVQLHHWTGVHSPALARLLLEQYVTLLGSIAQAPDATLASLALVGEQQRQLLLAGNAQGAVVPAAELLPTRVARWVRERPQALAIIDDGQAWTWQQLDALAGALAGQLQARGVSADSVVGLALPRSAHWLAAVLACWKCAAAYLPMDPAWPLARREQVGRLAGVQVQIDSPLIAEAQAAPQPFEACVLQAETAAYVLFTSGSTGEPKGVVIEHGQLAGYLEAAEYALDLGACKHFAFSATVAADLGHTSLFGAVQVGATLHVASDAVMQDPVAFAAFIRTQGIDCLKIVPSHLAALLDCAEACLPATLVLGGEAPSAQLLERIARLAPQARVFNHYGPTEATVGVLVQRLRAGEPSASLGQVLAGNRIYLLTAERRLAAVGELAEVYLGGRQLCRGYLGGDAGESRFIDNPLKPGERLYRTGDLARYQADGSVLLQGRQDHQVKIRGFRIELAEVEARLLEIAGIGQGAVVTVETQPGQLELLACYTGQGLDEASVRARLAECLPAAMVPAQVRRLPSLPLLANGKLDRRALAQLPTHSEQASAGDEPQDALQTLLAQRMAKLLGHERIGIHTDFFAAGGHSLLIIKLVAGLRKLLNCEVAPAVVFEHPTVAGLAEALQAAEASKGQLLKIAQARLQLERMSPEEKAQMLARANNATV
ncbi:AMP-binding protein [Pseudomonas sp. NPDC089401]|uniref:non-ribosomal peptide synthetase n=1 Tax=Pseudomonas sp. NPDC089401 TaxID=3364462 RepID=UPI0037FC2936